MTAPLASDSFPEERRLATVVFADIMDFTALAEQMDFEKVTDLIKDVWLRLDQVIVDHGGYIDKHIGDEVMAVWGAPYGDEDDAEEAVDAALALQDTLEEYIQNSNRKGVERLKIRVGINTGYVLAGYVGLRDEYTVMGDAVNVASRLEERADPGTILISESTYRIVRGVYEVQRLEPFSLKGKTQPVQAYQVIGRLAQPSRLRYRDVGGLTTRMVARDDELSA